MNPRRYLFTDIIFNLVWLSFFYGIFIMPAYLFFRLRLDTLLFIAVAAFTYFFLIRCLIKPVVPLFLAHIIVPIAVWFLAPGLFYILLYVSMVALMVVFSLFQRYKRTRTFSSEFLIFVPVFFVVFTLIMASQGHGYMSALFGVLIVIVSIGGRLHVRMTHINSSLEAITQSSNQPVEKILAFDYKAVVVLGVLLVGLILLLNAFVVRPALEAVVDRWPDIQFEPVVPPEPEGIGAGVPPEMGVIGYFMSLPARGPALLWRILDFLLLYVGLPLFALVFCVLIFRITRNIYKRLRKRKNQELNLDDSFDDIKEFIRTPRAKRSRFLAPRSENRLRRLFRETVTRHMKNGVPIIKSDTPGQMTGKIHGEDIRELAEEYAGVRYR